MLNRYAPVTSPPRLLDGAAINATFGKPAGWFSRDRVRKALYARGFPQPVIRGRWLRTAVESWLESEGNRLREAPKRRPRAPKQNGYAPVV